MSEWVGACVGVWVCEWVRECVCVYWFLKSQIKCRINSDLLRLLTLSRSKPTSKKPTAMYIYMQICTSRYLQYCSLPFEHSWGIFDLDTPDLTGSEDHLVSEGTLHDTDMIRWYRSFYIISAPILMTKEVSKSECYQVHVPTICMFTPPLVCVSFNRRESMQNISTAFMDHSRRCETHCFQMTHTSPII